MHAGKDAEKQVEKFGLPLMQCALAKSFSGATGNDSVFSKRWQRSLYRRASKAELGARSRRKLSAKHGVGERKLRTRATYT